MTPTPEERAAVATKYPIPPVFQPGGPVIGLRREPREFFPDDPASRWMMSLLSASHDLGISLKLVTPYMVAQQPEDPTERQYQFSHMFYFWRLWLSHTHEAWLMFNKRIDHPVATAVKAHPDIRKAFAAVCTIRGKRVVKGITAGQLMEKCRNITFHYDEREGDKWKRQLKIIKRPFPLFISPESGVNVDARWLIADEYMLSRLNRINYGSRRLHKTASNLTHAIRDLITACQKIYFQQRDPGMIP